MANQFQRQLSSLKKQRYFMLVLAITFVLILVWTIMSIFVSQKKLTISSDLKRLGTPITPTLDEQVIYKLEQKKSYSDQDLEKFSIYKVISLDDDEEEITKVEISKNSSNVLEVIKEASASSK